MRYWPTDAGIGWKQDKRKGLFPAGGNLIVSRKERSQPAEIILFPDFITFFNFSYKTALQVSVAAFFSLIWVTHGNFVSSCYVCA